MRHRMRGFLAWLAGVWITLSGGANDMGDPSITMDPCPPTVGQPATIHHPGPYPVTIELDWGDPNIEPRTIVVHDANGADLIVPQADSLAATDASGHVEGLSTMIYQ